MDEAIRANQKSQKPSKETERQLKAQETTPPDDGGNTKAAGTMPVLGDTND